MASLTQQPLLAPQPNLEPPSFPILRDIESRKIINEQGNPYGYDPSSGQSQQSLWTGNGRGTFDPYSGNYGANPNSYPNAGSMAGGGGGMYGFGGGQSMQPPLMTGGMGGGMQEQQAPVGQGAPQGQMGGQTGFIQQLLAMLQQGGGQHQMQAPQMTDGYTLNNQITNMGNDGCQMGNDSMRQPMRPPMAPHAPDPRHAMAMKLIMAAMAAKRMQRQRPQMGGMQPQGGMQRPMGMDGWNTQNNNWMPSSTPTNPPVTDPYQATQNSYNMQNQMGAGGSRPQGPTVPFPAQPPAPTGTPPTLASLGDSRNDSFLRSNPGSHGSFGTTPTNYSSYGIQNWMQGGAAPAATPIGHDSPYMFQRGPMSPLGMDAMSDQGGVPGYPSFGTLGSGGGGSSQGAGNPASAAIMQILGGGGGGVGMGGNTMMRRRQPMGYDGQPKHQGGKFVVAGKGGRPHRIFDEPRVI